DEQVIEDLASEDGPGHDPRHVFDPHPAIPDPLRVDHHRGTVLALLQATGVVSPGQHPEPGSLEFLLERLPQRLLAGRIAAAALVAPLTDIAANKDMVGKCRHRPINRPSDSSGPHLTRDWLVAGRFGPSPGNPARRDRPPTGRNPRLASRRLSMQPGNHARSAP